MLILSYTKLVFGKVSFNKKEDFFSDVNIKMEKNEINVEFGKCSFEENVVSATEKKDELLSEVGDILSGNLYFNEHHIDSKHFPFIFTHYSADMKKLTEKIFDEWKLPLPKIVLFTIADTEDSPSDEYRIISSKLAKGLVHVPQTTQMWLCTDGLNEGLSKDIGKAFEYESSRKETGKSGMQYSGFSGTALIGICRKDRLTFEQKFQKYQEKGQSEQKDEIKEAKAKKSINQGHEFFIIFEDTTVRKIKSSKFILDFAKYINKKGHNEFEFRESKDFEKSQSSEIPVIVLLLHGRVTQIDLILGYLKLNLPLIIFEGSGGLADLLVYAYRQVDILSEGSNLAEYIEEVLKPEVSKRMHSLCPDFSDYKIWHLTEKILDSIKYLKLHDQEFITILDLNNIKYKTSDLIRYLLKALFKSHRSDTVKNMNEMKKDLLLAMDCNCADVAVEEVFAADRYSRFQIDGEIFFRALIKPRMEDFVTLFLNQGFIIHSYLDSSNLLELFQNSLSSEFFRSIVWENVLGLSASTDISRDFLDSKLIILLEEMTGIPSLINSYELDWNCRSIYEDRTPAEAERKAIAALSLWAILSYRVQLVKTLWRHSQQPIHIALVCSVILKKLEAFVTDLSLKNEMDKASEEFSKMAVGVMTLCYESVPCRALDLLNEKNRVWSHGALMEMAAFAKNKMFIAHPCCQKYLDRIFMGHTKIKDLPYGHITIPVWIKIILSAFLIFPIYLWIKFEFPEEIKHSASITTPIRKSQNFQDMDNDRSLETQNSKLKEPGFFRKIYFLWTAPVTKFWLYNVFYVLFLICFSMAVIWPACGNVFLDFFTCIWIATLILDSIYNVYTLNQKYSSIYLIYNYFEISGMIIFLFYYSVGRIILKQTFITPYSAKVAICIALLYFYYRLIFVALPISSDLGPMLFRVKRMITVDFMSYIRVTILVIISNGIALHAAVYPDYPFNLELVRRAFFDSLTSFFLVPMEKYSIAGPKCIRLQRDVNKLSFIGYPSGECKVGRYFKYDCPNPGVWPYLLGLQYMIILRLILATILIALFSNTTRKLQEQGKYIWKYQRYQLVTHFSSRLTLPPPLCIITFIYMICLFTYKLISRYLFRYKSKRFQKTTDINEQTHMTEIDYSYWNIMTKQYHENTVREKAEIITTRKRMEHVGALIDDLTKQSRALTEFTSHLNELQLGIKNAHKYLKDDTVQVSMRERLRAKDVPQIFSRMSPYPNTRVCRFPVRDSHVSWENSWSVYDPVAFTLPKETFPAALIPYVDINMQKVREIEGENFRMPHFNWNKLSVSPAGICVNRQSWITDKSKSTFVYDLDSEGFPKNPMGRTGLKGRGCLPRWGPNHHVFVVITRWSGKVTLSGKYMEVILMNSAGHLSLPGGYVRDENRYEIIYSLFQCEEKWRESQDMITFFESLKDSLSKRSSIWQSSPEEQEPDFLSEKVKLGYMDEETNTDQAWCEAEVWHFHYNTATNIDSKFKAEMQWYMLSEERLLSLPIGQAAIILSIAKKMEAILEVM